jgi:hypothetical protein
VIKQGSIVFSAQFDQNYLKSASDTRQNPKLFPQRHYPYPPVGDPTLGYTVRPGDPVFSVVDAQLDPTRGHVGDAIDQPWCISALNAVYIPRNEQAAIQKKYSTPAARKRAEIRAIKKKIVFKGVSSTKVKFETDGSNTGNYAVVTHGTVPIFNTGKVALKAGDHFCYDVPDEDHVVNTHEHDTSFENVNNRVLATVKLEPRTIDRFLYDGEDDPTDLQKAFIDLVRASCTAFGGAAPAEDKKIWETFAKRGSAPFVALKNARDAERADYQERAAWGGGVITKGGVPGQMMGALLLPL